MSNKLTVPYVLSLILACSSVYFFSKHTSPNSPAIVIYFILPLTVAILSLSLFNVFIPKASTTSDKATTYTTNFVSRMIYNMDYIQMYPPMFVITIIVFILLFTNNLH